MKKYIIFLLMLCFAISYAQQNDIKTLIAKAEQGNAEAQNNLGLRKACKNSNNNAYDILNELK